jgi:hypothetical protein
MTRTLLYLFELLMACQREARRAQIESEVDP